MLLKSTLPILSFIALVQGNIFPIPTTVQLQQTELEHDRLRANSYGNNEYANRAIIGSENIKALSAEQSNKLDQTSHTYNVAAYQPSGYHQPGSSYGANGNIQTLSLDNYNKVNALDIQRDYADVVASGKSGYGQEYAKDKLGYQSATSVIQHTPVYIQLIQPPPQPVQTEPEKRKNKKEKKDRKRL